MSRNSKYGLARSYTYNESETTLNSPVESSASVHTRSLDNIPLTELTSTKCQSPKSPAPSARGRFPRGRIRTSLPVPLHHHGDSEWTSCRLEIAAVALSLVSFVSLIFVLVRANGTHLAMWEFPLGLSINTVTSVLSVALTGPLVHLTSSCLGQMKWSWFAKRSGPINGFLCFDEASRGPVGCLSLLWWLKGRYWASLGALLTLALLFVDPFLQSLIDYQGELVGLSNVPGQQFIAIASHLDIGQWYNQAGFAAGPSNAALEAYILRPDVGMAATALIGFVNTTGSLRRPTQTSETSVGSTPSLSCATGNCTFTTYSSLGVCSECVDISDRIVKQAWTGMPDQTDVCNLVDFKVIGNYTVYSIPYGPHAALIEAFDGLFNETSDICDGPQSSVQLSVGFRPQDTFQFREWEAMLASFAILKAPQDYTRSQVAWEDAEIKGYECALRFCGRVYNTTTIRYGDLIEMSAADEFERVEASYQPIKTVPSNVTAEIAESLSDQGRLGFYEVGGQGTDSMGLLVRRSDLQLALPASSTFFDMWNIHQNFNISQKAIATMMAFFSLNSTLFSMASALQDSDNITATFENAAHMISNRMRQIDGGIAIGEGQQWTVFIRVRWAFLTFPIVILLASMVFATATVFETWRARLGVMKTDLKPVLLHEFDEETKAVLENRASDGKDVNSAVFRLVRQEDGFALRLRKQD